jgi:hypothetical protein
VLGSCSRRVQTLPKAVGFGDGDTIGGAGVQLLIMAAFYIYMDCYSLQHGTGTSR